MKYNLIFLLLISSLIFPQETSYLFTLIPSSTESNSKGYVILNNINDPLGIIDNPALSGLLADDNYFAFGINKNKWMPNLLKGDEELNRDCYAVNLGLNFKKHKLIDFPLSVGLGFSKSIMNLGKMIITDTYSNQPKAVIDLYESSKILTFGINFNYLVKISFGTNIKFLESSLFEPFNNTDYSRKHNTNFYDYALLAEIPVAHIMEKLLMNNISFNEWAEPFFNLSFGLVKSNLGGDEISRDTIKIPNPKNVTAGMGLNIGIKIIKTSYEWIPLSFNWSIEANDLLVTQNKITYNWEYTDGFGNISFWDEIILGKTNKFTTKRKGWEFNFFEFLILRGGKFEEDGDFGNRNFSTYGKELRLGGIIKLVNIVDEELIPDNILKWILDRFDFRYSTAKYETTDPHHPLNGTEYYGLSLLFRM